MCAEGMVGITIFALTIVATLPAAQRQQKLTIWLVRCGSFWDIRCAPATRGGTGIQCGSAVQHEGLRDNTRSKAAEWTH